MMTAPTTTKVEKARLSKLPANAKANDPKLQGEGAVEVQFNPTSLKISRTNNPDSAKTTQGPKRQHTAPQPATLTFDLEFDTAEIAEGGTGKAKDVRSLTADVRKFVSPQKADAPPRILFEWGPLRFPGIVTNLTEDIDYFAPDGTPLRAKLSITITEQDLSFEANAVGPGAVKFDNATKPGQPPPGSTPGTSGTGSPTSVQRANDGDSVQQVLTRSGADPAAWRSAMNGLTNPVGLSAGAEVQLDAGISAGASLSAGVGASLGVGAGLGVSAGFSASAEVSAEAALGGALGIGASAGVSVGISAGFGRSDGGWLCRGVGADVGRVRPGRRRWHHSVDESSDLCARRRGRRVGSRIVRRACRHDGHRVTRSRRYRLSGRGRSGGRRPCNQLRPIDPAARQSIGYHRHRCCGRRTGQRVRPRPEHRDRGFAVWRAVATTDRRQRSH
jgi:hypothetical protein